LVFYSSDITMMHGPINISFTAVFTAVFTKLHSDNHQYTLPREPPPLKMTGPYRTAAAHITFLQ